MNDRARDTEPGLLGRYQGGYKHASPAVRRLMRLGLPVGGALALLLLHTHGNTPLFAGAVLAGTALAVYRILASQPRNRYPTHTAPTPANSPDMAAGMRVLSITEDTALRSRLAELFDGWQTVHVICPTGLRACAELISAAERSAPYAAVLIDAARPDIAPGQLARLIRREPTLGSPTLIALGPSGACASAVADLADFDATVPLPVDKTLLFNALRGRPPMPSGNPNITRLIDRYEPPRQTLATREILLAAADQHHRMHIRRILERAGHRVYVVENGEQALNALDTQTFDLAILERHMPIMGGIEAIKLHRFTHLHDQWLPFIVLTSADDTDAPQQCRKADVDACLVVSTEPVELLAQVGRLCPHPRTKVPPDEATDRTADASPSRLRQAVLGQSTLSELEKLGAGKDFVGNLIHNFLQDSDYLLAQMESACRLHQYQVYIDLAHTFKDSAGNLGALAIYNLSVTASRLSETEFAAEGSELVVAIRKAFELTRQALLHYLADEGDSASRH